MFIFLGLHAGESLWIPYNYLLTPVRFPQNLTCLGEIAERNGDSGGDSKAKPVAVHCTQRCTGVTLTREESQPAI